MLIFERGGQERLRIGDSIEITVVRVLGDRVDLGVDAPRVMEIQRGEARPGARPHTRRFLGGSHDASDL